MYGEWDHPTKIHIRSPDDGPPIKYEVIPQTKHPINDYLMEVLRIIILGVYDMGIQISRLSRVLLDRFSKVQIVLVITVRVHLKSKTFQPKPLL